MSEIRNQDDHADREKRLSRLDPVGLPVRVGSTDHQETITDY